MSEALSEPPPLLDRHQVWNVKDLAIGASGHALIDDAESLQRAFDTCPIDGTVLVPRGTFYTKQTLTVSRRINIRGEGVIKEFPGTILSSILTFSSGAAGATMRDVTVEGVETEGTWDSSAAQARVGITISADEVALFDVRVKNKSTGIRVEAVSDVELSQCKIKSFVQSALSLVNNAAGISTNGSLYCRIVGGYVRNSGQGILLQGRSKNCLVEGFHVRDCWDNGVYGSSCEFTTVTCTVKSAKNTGCKLRGFGNAMKGCTFDDVLLAGVISGYAALPDSGSIDEAYTASLGLPANYYMNGYGNVITGCTARVVARHAFEIDQTTAGAATMYPHHCSITGNTIIDCCNEAGYTAILAYGNAHIISGNRIFDTSLADYGILVAGNASVRFRGVQITGNQLEDPDLINCIYVAVVRDAVITGNIVNCPAASARNIRVQDGIHVRIANNSCDQVIRVDGTASDGVYIDGNLVSGSITLSTIPTNCQIAHNEVPSMTFDGSVSYRGNKGHSNIHLYEGIIHDAFYSNSGLWSAVSTVEGLKLNCRHDFNGFTQLYVRNNNSGTTAGAVFGFQADGAGGYVGVLSTGFAALSGLLADRLILGCNSDASGGVFRCTASGQTWRFFAGNGVYIQEIDALGGFRLQPVTNGRFGWVLMESGVATVYTTAVDSTISRIFAFSQESGVVGALRVNSITDGTSFQIASSEPTDEGVVAWFIIEEI